MKSEPLIVERTLQAPVSRVWQALTNLEQMRKWYFNVSDFKPEPGFEFTFEGGKDDQVYVHLCQVTTVIPNKKLQYSWKYKGYPGSSVVTFELFEEGNATRVKLTHEGLETFVGADFARENFQMGWTHILGTSLKEFVEPATV
jgi:uncharacterized protein YndB with AHSA1/START domain